MRLPLVAMTDGSVYCLPIDHCWYKAIPIHLVTSDNPETEHPIKSLICHCIIFLSGGFLCRLNSVLLFHFC